MVIFIVIAAFIALVVAYILAINFTDLATQIPTYIDAIIYYISCGLDIVWIFVPKTITIVIMTLALSVQIVVWGYHFVMWILRKIPVASID